MSGATTATELDQLDTAMASLKYERRLNYDTADLVSAVAELWAIRVSWLRDYRALHEELQVAHDNIRRLEGLLEELTVAPDAEPTTDEAPPVTITKPIDGIELWWGVERGVEVRTVLSRVLLVCDTHAGGARCRNAIRESGLSWAPGESTTPEHEAVLRRCLRFDGVTPGLDLARWFAGRLA